MASSFHPVDPPSSISRLAPPVRSAPPAPETSPTLLEAPSPDGHQAGDDQANTAVNLAPVSKADADALLAQDDPSPPSQRHIGLAWPTRPSTETTGAPASFRPAPSFRPPPPEAERELSGSDVMPEGDDDDGAADLSGSHIIDVEESGAVQAIVAPPEPPEPEPDPDATHKLHAAASDGHAQGGRGSGPNWNAITTPGRSRAVVPVLIGLGFVVSLGVVGLVVSFGRGVARRVAEVHPSVGAAASAAAAGVPESTLAAQPVIACTIVPGARPSLAPRVHVPSGVEVVTRGGAVALGFAVPAARARGDAYEATALAIDPATLAVTSTSRSRASGSIRKVEPFGTGKSIDAFADVDTKGSGFSRTLVGADPPLDMGALNGALVYAAHGGGEPTKLWDLEAGIAVEALRAAPVVSRGERGWAVAFRGGSAIWLGSASGEKTLTPRGPLFRIPGLGAKVGSPALAASGATVLAAWADRADASSPWGVRWVRWVIGEPVHDASTFTLPAGGLGGQAMSPALAALPGGGFLLSWTEGPVSSHQVRAQTLDGKGTPVGEPLTVSPEGVNAGQAQAAVAESGRGLVAFLAAKGRDYEIVATPISCPAR